MQSSTYMTAGVQGCYTALVGETLLWPDLLQVTIDIRSSSATAVYYPCPAPAAF